MFAKYALGPMLAAIPGVLSRIMASKIADGQKITVRQVIYRTSTVALFGLMGGGLALYLDLHYLIGCTMAALFGNCGGSCLKIWRAIIEKQFGLETTKIKGE
jgi:hypothetical protein